MKTLLRQFFGEGGGPVAGGGGGGGGGLVFPFGGFGGGEEDSPSRCGFICVMLRGLQSQIDNVEKEIRDIERKKQDEENEIEEEEEEGAKVYGNVLCTTPIPAQIAFLLRTKRLRFTTLLTRKRYTVEMCLLVQHHLQVSPYLTGSTRRHRCQDQPHRGLGLQRRRDDLLLQFLVHPQRAVRGQQGQRRERRQRRRS